MSRKYKIILLTILVIIMSLGIPDYLFLSLKHASASNAYVEDIVFYYEEGTGYFCVDFKVKTGFTLTHDFVDEKANQTIRMKGLGEDNNIDIGGWFWQYDLIGADQPITYTAGITYKNYIYSARQIARIGAGLGYNYEYDNYEINGGSYIDILGNTDYYSPPYEDAISPDWIENDDVYYIELPSLSLTYPATDDAEIWSDFDIEGTITQPSPYEYNQVMAYAFFYNPYEETPYSAIGRFTTPLTATSSQEFSLPIIGLPITYPNKVIIYLELQYLNPETETITETYREGSGTEWPWQMEITTRGTGTAPGEYPPEWNSYFDIYRPSVSNDGYYKLTTPTSTIEFIYNFPETYKVRITEEEDTKLATSTFGSIDTDGNLRFTVDNFDASTSTPYWVEANIYNMNDELIITMLFPILGLEPGSIEDIGFWNVFKRTMDRMINDWLFPSVPTVLNKYKTNLVPLLETKIPYCYFFDVVEAIQAIDVDTATTTPDISFTIAGNVFAFNPFDIGATGLTETEGWTTLYNIMEMACYLMFVLYVFGRIRDRTTNTAD